MVALGDPRGDDPDHAGMPVLPRQDDSAVDAGVVGRLDQREGLGEEAAVRRLAVRVHLF